MTYIPVLESLEKIEAAAQGNERLAALKAADCAELRELLVYALSPDITFGVKKLPEYQDRGESYGSGLKWSFHLKDLLKQLATRNLTGQAAQDAIAFFLSWCNPTEAKWAERIIKQDLRINVGAKDVNKAFGETVIYLFEVPLATDYKKVKEKDLKGKWVHQPKLDGGRAVAILPGDGAPVRMLSRTGKEWGNFESVRTQLQEWNSHRKGPTIYLDGEVVSLDVDGRIDFQMIQKTMMRKDGVEVGKLQFVVFDAAMESEWREPELEYAIRLGHSQALSNEISQDGKLDFIKPIPFMPTKDPSLQTLEGQCLEFVEDGYEGGMARRMDLPVENKRGKRLLKIKTFLDTEAEVTGAVEGTGKYVGMLGALQCRLPSGKEFEIGSGFDDKQRKHIWERFLAGDKFEAVNFKYFELTDDGIPRFPIFRYFRIKE